MGRACGRCATLVCAWGEAAVKRSGEGERVPVAKQRWHLLACLALVFGLAVADSGFTRWRNDPGNFQDADGRWPGGESALLHRRHLRPVQIRLWAGAALVLCAVALFTREPV